MVISGAGDDSKESISGRVLVLDLGGPGNYPWKTVSDDKQPETSKKQSWKGINSDVGPM